MSSIEILVRGDTDDVARILCALESQPNATSLILQ